MLVELKEEAMKRKRHTWKPKRFDPIAHAHAMSKAMIGSVPSGKMHSTPKGKRGYTRREGKKIEE